MSTNIYYTTCPCCSSSQIQQVMQIKDYSVSQQNFEVWHCNNCACRFTQNVPNAATIAPYYQSANYISHTDTQEGFINSVYHRVRKFTLQAKRKLIVQSTSLPLGSLLDIGAGTGAFVHTMQQANWTVTGLEPDAAARNIALQKFGLKLQEPQQLFSFQEACFDVITMWHVLEHVHDLHGYFRQFANILKKKGQLFIAVPNYTSKDAAVYKEAWAAYDVPRHLYHFAPNSINHLASMYGFTIKQHKPMWFDSFYVSMLSEGYTVPKGNLLKAFMNGLFSNLAALFDSKKCSSVIYILEKN